MDLAHFFDNAPAEKSLWRPSLDCGDLSGIALEAKKTPRSVGRFFAYLKKYLKSIISRGVLTPNFSSLPEDPSLESSVM